MSFDYKELEAFIRGKLRIQLDDDDIGKAQLIDLYDYLMIGLEIDEELEKTFTMYQWASIISSEFEEARQNAEFDKLQWQGQMATDLKGTATRSSDEEVRNAYRSDPEWIRLSRVESKYNKFASIFRSFAIILLKKSQAISSMVGARYKAGYGSFNIKDDDEEDAPTFSNNTVHKRKKNKEKVSNKITNRIKRKPVKGGN